MAAFTLASALGFVAALGQYDHFRADALGNGIQLTAAHVRFEKFQIAALDADDGKAGPAGQFADVMALADKYFNHFKAPL
jgi:hypothetical protein